MAIVTSAQAALDADDQEPFETAWGDPYGEGVKQQIIIDSKQLPSGVAPVIGNFTEPDQSSSTFVPLPGRGFNVTLWNVPEFQVALVRSFDGETWLPVDVILGPATKTYQEPENGVQYQLQSIAVTGTLNYRLSQ